MPSKFTPGLFTHKTRDIVLSLVVDDFGVKYTKREDTEHLLKTIQDRYPIKVDWEPTFYLEDSRLDGCCRLVNIRVDVPKRIERCTFRTTLPELIVRDRLGEIKTIQYWR